MWIVYACGSALFAGLTAILAKCGIKKTASDAATAIRTIVVLLFSWLMVGIVGSGFGITKLSSAGIVFSGGNGHMAQRDWGCMHRRRHLSDDREKEGFR